MKITLSKSQWESIGKKAGWMTFAGGWGHLSEDAADILEAQVLIKGREGLSPKQIALHLRTNFKDVLSREPLNDQEMADFIRETKMMFRI